MSFRIRSLELENFQAFGDRMSLSAAPITLILGENSAGKSSILRVLHLLRQSLESEKIFGSLTPDAKHGIVDLGSFQELLFNHDLSRRLKIQILFDKDDIVWDDNAGDLRISTNTYGIEFHFEHLVEKQEVSLYKLEILDSEKSSIARFLRIRDVPKPESKIERDVLDRKVFLFKNSPIIDDFSCGRPASLVLFQNTFVTSSEDFWRNSYESSINARSEIVKRLMTLLDDAKNTILYCEGYPLARISAEIEAAIAFYKDDFSIHEFVSRMREQQGKAIIVLDGILRCLIDPEYSEYFPEGRIESNRKMNYSIHDVTQLVKNYCHDFHRMLRRILPIGPYREPPSRWHIFGNVGPQDVGINGEYLPELLFENPELVELTNKWLKRLDIGYQIKILDANTRYGNLYEIRCIDERRGDALDVSMKDLGFGISQILPIVVQCTMAKLSIKHINDSVSQRRIISIEQPEVHIHPRLQANLGDLFAESIKSGNQLIIETHSEHLVLRLQRLIRTGKLKAEDVSVLYVSRGKSGSHVQRLHLDSNGEFIDDWPGGFFPERLEELL